MMNLSAVSALFFLVIGNVLAITHEIEIRGLRVFLLDERPPIQVDFYMTILIGERENLYYCGYDLTEESGSIVSLFSHAISD